MNINTMMRGVFLAIGVCVAVAILVVIRLNVLLQEVDRLADIRYHSYQTADELRQSSDDLTRLGRTYVVTGDEQYEKMYMDILDIRNGKKARPDKYHLIYWDLVLNYGDKPKPDGKRIELQKMMRDLGFTEDEFARLKEAQNNSDGLVGMEVKAMNAVKGKFPDASGNYTLSGEPDPAMAIALLHSKEYHQEKAKIMRPIDEFFKKLESRTESQLIEAEEEVQLIVWVGTLLMVIVLAAAGAGYYIVHLKVTQPIVRMAKSLDEFDSNSDLSQRLHVDSENELGMIGSAINNLLDNYNGTITKINEVTSSITQVSKAIDAVSSTNAQLSNKQGGELEMAASAMEQMTAALATVSDSTSEAEAHAASTESEATTGLSTFQSTEAEFGVLENEFGQTAETIAELTSETHRVGNVLEVIKSIAEQTNLLALNAAIEAARAGEQGRGFAVVADEVRSLAQRTQESTVEIESMISMLQEKANSSTTTIERSADKMKSTRDNMGSASQALKSIQSSASEIHGLNSSIASSTEEQLTVSNEISRNITNVKGLSNEMNDKVRELQPLLKDLVSNTDEIVNAVAHMKVV
ncbi:methyl-accepting chemotaxis protein [Pleionea sp. CnH1-48]|uniref:methyl-accepting chemotaxis protein n=1 Tax=Pleionea sp. CnH1-48 TaxID=2954494 RepID=UPI0020981D89|nr:methyl-accepting chemotaxis protein [Pleionea sp. CnH1-48]MCO7223663.1 methyl-accepting chemotaxis protein [Pleionea sp. CnH1-48]